MNEYKLSIRVGEEPLKDFYVYHAGSVAQYSLELKHVLATELFILLQSLREPESVFLAKCSDIVFAKVEFIGECTSATDEAGSSVVGAARGKAVRRAR
jgi:hypothetical protein